MDQATFAKLAIDTQPEKLPVRYYTRKTLTALVEDCGFEVIDYATYHHLEDLGTLDEVAFRDEIINKAPHLQEICGRDMYMCAVAA